MSDYLPNYDAWKTDAPDWKPGEEEAARQKNAEQRADFREALEACIQDNRGELWLSEILDITRDVLRGVKRTPGEPEHLTKGRA